MLRATAMYHIVFNISNKTLCRVLARKVHKQSVENSAKSYKTWLKDMIKDKAVAYKSVRDGLKAMYENSLEPLESAYHFHQFHSPRLRAADFDNNPSVMLIGQYSTGKTTFIQHIIGKDYPGQRIGPEPTTDRFIVIMNGKDNSIVPGNALVVDPSMPYAPLSKFGNKFLNRFQCSKTCATVLENLTMIDTPGILAGEKQLLDRGYDFIEVVQWFAERVDRVILLFDAHKLDISDEFRQTIEVLGAYEDKLKIVLNKADRVNAQQLMRVYGALMWSLGKIVHTPEVVRVYIGSFWNHPLQHGANRDLFELEHHDLLTDLQGLPRQNTIRKLNDFIRRARLAKVHAYIISEIHDQIPWWHLNKDAKKEKLIRELDLLYRKLQADHSISGGDFPDLNKMQQKLKASDFSQFKSLDKSLIAEVNHMLESSVPQLMAMMPLEEQEQKSGSVQGGVFEHLKENPFKPGAFEGVYAGRDTAEWIVAKDMTEYEKSFKELVGEGSKMSASVARDALIRSKLPSTELSLIWSVCDVDKDDFLDLEEWALANHLVKIRLAGHELPSTLPAHLVPPGVKKRAAV